MADFLTMVSRGKPAVWEEMFDANSPEYSGSRTDSGSVRVFLVEYNRLDQFVDDCFPTGGMPGQHPTQNYLWVNNFLAKPMVGASPIEFVPGMSSPEKFTVTVNYSPYSIDPASNGDFQGDPTLPYNELIGNMSFRTEAMTLPGDAFKWETTSVDVDGEINPVMMIQLMDFTLSTPRATSIPFAAIRANIGKVNKNQFFGAAAETCLYQGTQINFRFGTDGNRSFDLAHQFTEKRIQWDGSVYGWNHYMDPATFKWDRLINKDTNEPTYSTSETFPALMA